MTFFNLRKPLLKTAALAGISVLLLSCTDSNGGASPELNCDSDPVTPLPQNFSAIGYWTLNTDLQGVYPPDDSIALARHYCKFGAEEGRTFGDNPIYSSNIATSSDGAISSNGEIPLSSATDDNQSSTTQDDGDDCERTLVEDAYFKFYNGDTETNNPILRGWTEGGIHKFAPGEKLVPKGYDCNAAVEVSFLSESDEYNLFLVATWKGDNIDSTLVEKVVIKERPSSSSNGGISSQAGDPCSGYPEWDSVPWTSYEQTTLYSFDGGLYRCEATTTPATCAWPPDNEWSDWGFVRKCDGGGISSTTTSSSSVKVSSSVPKSSITVSSQTQSSVAISSSSKPSSSSTTVISSSSGGGHCVLNWFTEAMFNSFFPNRHSVYTWPAFVEALNKVPEFICQGQAGSDANKQKQELAAVFAHWGQEVAHLKYNEEICGTQGSCLNNYNTDWSNGSWPAQPGQSYHGRGAKQISWPGNYGMASQYLFGDKMVLLKDPNRVKNEGMLAFATSFWYWISNQNGKTCTSQFWTTGFGATTMVINGSLECGGNYDSRASNRVNFYNQYLQKLGVSDSRNKETGCR